MKQSVLDVSSLLDGKRVENHFTAHVNSGGAAVYHSRNLTPLPTDPAETYGTFVASDPKEYLIRFSCIELGKDDEREQRVIISVRDPNTSEARINELMEMAN